MALTITLVDSGEGQFGDLRYQIATVKFDNSYSTGGKALPTGNSGTPVLNSSAPILPRKLRRETRRARPRAIRSTIASMGLPISDTRGVTAGPGR